MTNPSKAKEIDIEAIETSKGNVPTVHGLETVVNAIMDQFAPELITKAILGIHSEIQTIKSTQDYLSTFIQQIGDNLGEFLVLLAKLNSNINSALDQIANNRIDGFKDQQNTLIELQTILAKLLVQFQTLPVLQNADSEDE